MKLLLETHWIPATAGALLVARKICWKLMKRIARIYRIGPRSTVTLANAATQKLPVLFFKIN
jgi:hypothetical protein